MEIRRLAVVAFAVLALVVTACSPKSAPAPSLTPSQPEGGLSGGPPVNPELGRELFARMNAEREARGLPPLVWDAALAARAESWSATMAQDGSLRNSDLAGALAAPEFSAFAELGENFVLVPEATPTGTIDAALMGADGARRNVLSAEFSVVGVGVVCGSDAQAWVTINYGRTPDTGTEEVAEAVPPAAPVVAGEGGSTCAASRRVAAPAPTSPTTTPTTTPTTAPAPVAAGAVDGRRVGISLSYHPLTANDTDLARMLDLVAGTGAQWIRFDFYWSGVQTSRTSFNWSKIDRAVDAARARGLSVIGVLAYTPAWARPSGTNDHYPPTNPADFATFAGAAAQRYASRGVRVWEVWNEPNNYLFWQPKPDPAAYTELLRQSYTAIHSADPGATVLTGGTAPAGGTLDYQSSDGRWLSPWRFLNAIYAGGAKGYFDAVAHHPYAGQPYLPSVVAQWNAYQQTANLHDLMAANGDGAKQVWGTEAGPWTGGDKAVSEAEQSAYVAEYLTLWDRWPWTGPFMFYELRDKGTDRSDREQNFGLLRYDWSEKPAFKTFADAVSGP